MKRIGIRAGALGWLCVPGLVCCGGRTPVDWDAGEEGGRGSGGASTGGTIVKPNTGGSGGVPSAGTGGVGTGGKPSPGTGGKPSPGTGGKPSPGTGGVPGTGAVAGTCAPGLSACGKSCVNLLSDSNHCGSCVQACGDSRCVAGKCMGGQCPAGLLACGVQCIDPNSDPNHCGAFGTCNAEQAGLVCAGTQCRMGRCQSMPRSCQSILEQGLSRGDGYYEIAPYADARRVEKVFCNMSQENGGWTRCLEVQNTSREDLDGNTWFDRCVDWTMADWSRGELLIELKEANGLIPYLGRGKRNGPWTYDALTSASVPNDQASPSLHQAIPLSNSDWLWISGRGGSNQGCAGALGNGYGILTSPDPFSPADTPMRMMVMPYRLQVGSHEPRQFGFDNRQWFPSNEISFSADIPFGTCLAPPPFIGSFEFYVR